LFATQAAPVGPWQQVAQDDGIVVESRRHRDTELHELRIRTEVDLDIELLWFAINDNEHFDEFLPYLQESRVLAHSADGSMLVYQRITPPLLSPRDYVLWATVSRDVEQGVYLRRFQADNTHAPAPRKGVVRVQFCIGEWRLERVGAGRTRISYTVLADPGGVVPAWLVNISGEHSIKDLLHAVSEYARKLAWNP
jgi:ribosome-associated toxin RatA of RatAB toxin-antitoxin module